MGLPIYAPMSRVAEGSGLLSRRLTTIDGSNPSGRTTLGEVAIVGRLQRAVNPLLIGRREFDSLLPHTLLDGRLVV